MATTEEQIAQLEAILASGATSGSIDGRTVQFDHASIRKQLRALRDQQAIADGLPRRRPLAARIITEQ